jgi:GDP-L-fucose synthase
VVTISGKDISITFDHTKPVGDVGRSGDFEKARRALGWGVNTPLETGLRATYEWAERQIAEDRSVLE